MGHLYQTTSHHYEAQGTLEMEDEEEGYEMQSLGHNVAIIPMNSLQTR